MTGNKKFKPQSLFSSVAAHSITLDNRLSHALPVRAKYSNFYLYYWHLAPFRTELAFMMALGMPTTIR